MIKIIANRKLDLTDEELKIYNQICEAYKENGGPSLFFDLFESNNEGIITLLKPPKKMFSLEIYLFIMSVMQHQHLRKMQEQVDDLCKQIRAILSTK